MAKGRSDLALLAVFAMFVAAVTAADVFNVLHEHRRAGVSLPAWEPTVWEATSGLVIVALAPLVIFLAHRWPLGWPVRPLNLLRHAPAMVAFSLIHVTAMGGLRWAVYAIAGGRYDALGPLGDFAYEFRKDGLDYAGLVILHGVWSRAAAQAAAPGAQDGGEPIEVRDGPRRRFLRPSDIAWVEAAGNYVELHGPDGPLLHRASLAEMERRLDGFVRIHRSRLVRRAAIREVETGPSGDFTVRLADGTALAGSRRYRAAAVATHA